MAINIAISLFPTGCCPLLIRDLIHHDHRGRFKSRVQRSFRVRFSGGSMIPKTASCGGRLEKLVSFWALLATAGGWVCGLIEMVLAVCVVVEDLCEKR